MGSLYIKKSPKWVNYLSNDELDSFLEMYNGSPLVIGDVASWSKSTIQSLLKVVETYPNLSVFTSRDIYNPILYSRFPQIVKSPGISYHDDDNGESYHNLLQATQVPARLRMLIKGHSPLKRLVSIQNLNDEQTDVY